MNERRAPYVTMTQPAEASGGPMPLLIAPDDWRYNMLLRLEQQRQARLMLLIDADARCWFEVGRMECNKSDRELPFKI